MKPLACAAHLARVAALLGMSVSTLSAAPAIAPDLASCAAIAAPDARLACYDALAGRPAERAASTPRAAQVPAAAATPAAASTPSAAAAAPAAPAVPTTTAPASTFASDPRNFGFTESQKQAQAQAHAAPAVPAAIQARVTKIVANPVGRAYVVLDNGETWMFVDPADDPRLSPGESVTIKRGSLGSFLLLTPSKNSYHVHRTQ
jgi:hypothetical protein